MKKGLFLLPLVGGLLLTGCTFTIFGKEITLFEKKEEKGSGGSGGGGQVTPARDPRKEAKAPTADITIDISVIGEFVDESKTYPDDGYSFTLDNFVFDATQGVGKKTPEKSGGNYYNEQGALQFSTAKATSRPGGAITNYDPIIATQITVNWFATYASEAKMYQPVVKAATDPDAVASSTQITAAEGETVNGTETEGQQVGSDKQDHTVYAYTTTYSISGKNYFSIAAPNGALYVKSIVINK